MRHIMNMIRRRLQQIWRRAFPARHAIVRGPRQNRTPPYGAPGGPPYPDYGPAVDNFYPQDHGRPPDIEQGIRTIYEPAHEERRRTTFRRVSQSGDFENHAEVWTRDGNRMIVTVENGRAIDASGRIVRIQELSIQCSICGGYDSTGGHCYICARPLCGTHGLLCVSESNEMVCMCPEHFASMAAQWNSWAASDARKNGHPARTGPSAHPISGAIPQGGSYAPQ